MDSSDRICQVAYPKPDLACPERDSSGYQCEATGSHVGHDIGDHTILHALAGNGWSCAAIDQRLAADAALNGQGS